MGKDNREIPFLRGKKANKIRRYRNIKPYHKKRRRHKFINILVVVLSCLAVIALGGRTIYNQVMNTEEMLEPAPKEEAMVNWESKVARNFDDHIINFAFLGFGWNESREEQTQEGTLAGSLRSDTVMVASLNFEKNDISVMSIPRDTMVEINKVGVEDKLNHSYYYGYNKYESKETEEDPHQGGIETTLKTIQDFLGGVPIHYYVTMNMDAVEDLVDAVDGIYYDVDEQVRSHAGRGEVVLEEGYQKLDGNEFLRYVRARHMDDDFGRQERQQEIMVEAFEQMQEEGKLVQLPEIYQTVQDNVKTNLSFSQKVALSLYGMEEIDPRDIDTYTFEGTERMINRNGQEIYYFFPDEECRVELVEEVFEVEVEKQDEAVAQHNEPEQESQEQKPEQEPSADEEDGYEDSEGEEDEDNGQEGDDEGDNGDDDGEE